MLRKILPAALVLLLVPCLAFAQQGTIQGMVIDNQTENPLPGVNVVVTELQTGAATNAEGRYRIQVEPGTYTLQASFVGYQDYEAEVEVEAGQTVQQRIRLRRSKLGLDEVVVTGVATGRQTANLGFSVSKVGEESLQEVPSTDPANALRGKIAGAQIVQPSGDPGANAAIRLRGSTSITGDQSPLIIVDGIITDGSLNDINMNDVESIEVVKGAAASSLYGSLAGNGVIRITTQSGTESGELRVRVRSEYGQSEIESNYPKATRHPWVLDSIVARRPDGSTVTLTDPSEQELQNQIPKGSHLLTWSGRATGQAAEDGLFDNPFPVTYDNIGNVFTGKPRTSNYISIANQGDEYSYLASFERLSQGGTVEPVDPYVRNSIRLNADYTPDSRLSASFNSSYIKVETPNVQEQGQGDNYFYSVLTADPYMDMTERREDGTFTNEPTGYNIQASNWQNPLYVAQTRESGFTRRRIIAGVQLDFEVTDNLSLHANQSLDQQFVNRETFYPVGYQTPTPDPSVNQGSDFRRSDDERTAITRAWATYERGFGNVDMSLQAQYMFEDRSFSWHSSSGDQYSALGIRDLEGLNSDTYSIDSYQQAQRAENYYLSASVNYDDIVIADGVIRRDGSSLFGSEERWQWYYRGSLAYRLSQQFDIPNVQQLKLRASYGVSGNRPPFQAQYETYNVSSSGISPGVLGNENLRPSASKELEVGVDVALLERFTFSANYAQTTTEDDYLNVPLSSAVGFNSQWRNAATLESKAYEASLQGQILSGDDLNWSGGVTWSKITQKYAELERPPYYRTTAAALNVFRVEAGLPYGNLFGNKVLTSLDQLTVVDGTVLNAGGDSVDDFTVNEYGYVVPAGTKGTADEQVVYKVDESGNKVVEQIGNTNPDFSMGLQSNFSWKGVGLYAVLDWSKGADVYNYTKQLLYFNNQHKDLQEFAADGHHWNYANSSSTIYNQASATSYFVEDASYIKLREVAISYTLGQDQLSTVFGETVRQVELSVTGRNLVTLTDYSGWDPEVALRNNSTNFRIDEYAYPNYRTYTGAIELTF